MTRRRLAPLLPAAVVNLLKPLGVNARRDEARTKRLNEPTRAEKSSAQREILEPRVPCRLLDGEDDIYTREAVHPKQRLINNVNSRRCALADFRNAR